jgi:hypothetical protein
MFNSIARPFHFEYFVSYHLVQLLYVLPLATAKMMDGIELLEAKVNCVGEFKINLRFQYRSVDNIYFSK